MSEVNPDDDVADAELIPWPSDERLQHNSPFVAVGRPRCGEAGRDGWWESELIAERFLLGYTGGTLGAYQRDLRELGHWCRSMDLVPLTLQRHQVELFQQHLRTVRHLAPATISRKLSVAAGFFAYALDEGVIVRNPLHGVRRPRVDNEPTTAALTPKEVKAALAAASGEPRLFALCHLLFFTGVRVSSALNLDIGDLRSEGGYRVAAYHAKGGKRGLAVLPQTTCDALDRYVAGRTSGPVFLGARGRRWNRSDAWRQLRRLAVSVAPSRPNALHPHAWRAAFVTNADLAGVSLTDIADAALHSDTRTTLRYRRDRHSLDRHPSQRLVEFLAEHEA